MKRKKGLLLFEVAVVVLLVSVASLFLYRALGLFIKATKRSVGYFKLASFCEQKLWEIQVEEAAQGITGEIAGEGRFDSDFSWVIGVREADEEDVLRLSVIAEHEADNEYLDVLFYVLRPEEIGNE